MSYDAFKLASPPEYEEDDGQRRPPPAPRLTRADTLRLEDYDWTSGAKAPAASPTQTTDDSDINF